jgi:hypothetical protein
VLFRPGVGSGDGAGVLMENNNNMFIIIFIVQYATAVRPRS